MLRRMRRHRAILASIAAATILTAIAGGTARAESATAAFATGQAAYERGDYTAALSAWRRAAEQSHAEAEFRLGALYENGRGVAKDLEQARSWYARAAEHGSQKAQFNLGHMYATGTGVARDEAEAARWYRRAAELGNAHAQYTLGLMYSQGRGVERDLVRSYAWLTVAIHNFDPNMFRDNANRARREIEQRMNETERAEAERLLEEWASARH